MTRVGIRFAFSALASVALAVGCMNDAWIGAQRPLPLVSGDGGPSGTGGAPVTVPDASACKQVMCAKGLAACGNCVDDDSDGKMDMDDPECLSPCQNAEDTFANPRLDHGEGACTLDCYFDLDNGIGNDDCVWSHKCDPKSPEGAACGYDANEKLPHGEGCDVKQSDKCKSVCGPLIPNGCDCFGCCKVDDELAVFLGSTDDAGMPSCDLEHLHDDKRCKPCTLQDSCFNPCADCEICFGKRTLPASCMNGSSTCPAPVCPTGVPFCGDDVCLPSCPDGRSCVTGCCAEPPR